MAIRVFGKTFFSDADRERLDMLSAGARFYVDKVKEEYRLEQQRLEEERLKKEREEAERERLRKERERQEAERKKAEEAQRAASGEPKQAFSDSQCRYSLDVDSFQTEDLYSHSATIPAEYLLGDVMPPVYRNVFDRHTNMTFTEKLYSLMQARGLKSPEVYKAAGIDKSLFSRILSDRNYTVKKDTAIAVAFGLGLNLEEAKDLLERAGYSLSHSIPRDIAFEYFFRKGLKDVVEVDLLLDRLGFTPLSNAR